MATNITLAKLHTAETEHTNSHVFPHIVKIIFPLFLISDTFTGQVKAKGTPAANKITICLVKFVSLAAGGKQILGDSQERVLGADKKPNNK